MGNGLEFRNDRITAERKSSGKALEKYHAKRIQIAAHICRDTLCLLRLHIVDGTHQRSRDGYGGLGFLNLRTA